MEPFIFFSNLSLSLAYNFPHTHGLFVVYLYRFQRLLKNFMHIICVCTVTIALSSVQQKRIYLREFETNRSLYSFHLHNEYFPYNLGTFLAQLKAFLLLAFLIIYGDFFFRSLKLH